MQSGYGHTKPRLVSHSVNICQQFGCVLANCKQPPCHMWGGGHLHKECLEKGSIASIPTYCNWKLVGGEEPHPSNYRGCRHAKEEVRKRKLQRVPNIMTGRVFSSSHTTPGLSFAAEHTAAASATISCTGPPYHSERNECPLP